MTPDHWRRHDYITTRSRALIDADSRISLETRLGDYGARMKPVRRCDIGPEVDSMGLLFWLEHWELHSVRHQP